MSNAQTVDVDALTSGLNDMKTNLENFAELPNQRLQSGDYNAYFQQYNATIESFNSAKRELATTYRPHIKQRAVFDAIKSIEELILQKYKILKENLEKVVMEMGKKAALDFYEILYIVENKISDEDIRQKFEETGKTLITAFEEQKTHPASREKAILVFKHFLTAGFVDTEVNTKMQRYLKNVDIPEISDALNKLHEETMNKLTEKAAAEQAEKAAAEKAAAEKAAAEQAEKAAAEQAEKAAAEKAASEKAAAEAAEREAAFALEKEITATEQAFTDFEKYLEKRLSLKSIAEKLYADFVAAAIEQAAAGKAAEDNDSDVAVHTPNEDENMGTPGEVLAKELEDILKTQPPSTLMDASGSQTSGIFGGSEPLTGADTASIIPEKPVGTTDPNVIPSAVQVTQKPAKVVQGNMKPDESNKRKPEAPASTSASTSTPVPPLDPKRASDTSSRSKRGRRNY